MAEFDEDEPDMKEVAASASVAFALVQAVIMPIMRGGNSALRADILQTMNDAADALASNGSHRAAAKLRRILRNAESPTTINH